jgi:hypothetical protein
MEKTTVGVIMDRRLAQQCCKEIMAIAGLVAPHATATSFAIDGPAEDQYKALIDKLLRSGLDARLSRSYVEAKVSTLVGELAVQQSEEKAETGLRQLWQDSDSAPCYSVIVPLSGFDVPDAPLEVGKVRIRFLDGPDCDDLIGTISTIIDGTAHPEGEKGPMKALIAGPLKTHLAGQVVAESSVVAEAVRAREIAEEETRKALDVIRYTLAAVVPRGMRVEIGLMHEVYGGPKLTPLIERDGKSFTLHVERVGPLMLFKLDKETVDTMQDLGLLQMGQILGKKAPTALELSLIRSLRWFGVMTGQGDAGHRLVAGMVCLETLLAPGDREPISNYVAESAALLLGNGSSGKRQVKKRVKELYGIRSAIAHGASKPPGERDVDDLTAICGEVIQRLLPLLSELKSSKDVYERLENLKFA